MLKVLKSIVLILIFSFFAIVVVNQLELQGWKRYLILFAFGILCGKVDKYTKIDVPE